MLFPYLDVNLCSEDAGSATSLPRHEGNKMRMMKCMVSTLAVIGSLLSGLPGYAQQSAAKTADAVAEPIKVIFDTDIGDDVDDAFALALLVSRPEVNILGRDDRVGRHCAASAADCAISGQRSRQHSDLRRA